VVIKSIQNNRRLEYQDILALFAADLTAIEKAIFENLDSSNELLKTIATYINKSGGKRLRPLLVVLCSKMNGYSGQDHVSLGNAVEYIHVASLLHDDVLDGATRRRGAPSANDRWGNQLAVLGGNFLYTTAFDILLRDFSREIVQVLSRASLKMIEGEVLQRQWRCRLDIPEDIYLKITALKTASLISACCRTGAMLADKGTAETEALAEFGHLLGVAFQIVDDTLDYVADPAKLGKVLGGDLRQGTVTLPLIYLYHQEGIETEKKEIEEAIKAREITQDTISKIRELMEDFGCIDKALNKASGYVSSSNKLLETFRGSPLSTVLSSAADYILHRYF
jgi:octaprenyl-diphosphate synthase